MAKVVRSLLLGVILAVATLPALAAISLTLAKNADGTYDTAFPNGDKPVAGCTPPTGFTETNVGDGAGEICEQSSTEFDLNVSGSGTPTDAHLVYKDAGAGDIQIEARITDTFTGSQEAFAYAAVGIRESAAQGSWLFECRSLKTGATAIQVVYGTSGAYTTTNGAAGQTRPRYCAVTYDLSSGDVKGFESADGITWSPVASTNRAVSDPQGYMSGASKSATETTQVTLDNFALGSTIDAYTPSDPPAGDPPVLVSEIENQTATQNSAYSLNCAANWSGADTFAFSGLPTGITQTGTACTLAGTPTGTGVSNVTVTATNEDGDTPDSFTITVIAASGDIFLVPVDVDQTQESYNCASASGAAGATWSSIRISGSGTVPGPGDTIRIDNGTHGPIEFLNCTGADGNRINIVNDTTGAGPVIFQATAASGTAAHFFRCDNCVNVNLDGIGGWSGTPGACGIDPDDLSEDTAACGFQFGGDASFDLPTTWVRFHGTSSKNMVRGVEVDGTNGTGVGGIGISNNENAVKSNYPGTGTYTGSWREDVLITQNYIHDTGFTTGEGMYIGTNANEDSLPLRDIEISYNLLVDIARDGINGKYWLSGANSVHHNVIRRTGVGDAQAQGQQRGINITDGANADIYANKVEDAGRDGITCINNEANSSEPVDGPYYCNIFNNIVWDPGVFTDGSCFGISGISSALFSPVHIYNNTCVRPTLNGVLRSSGQSGGTCTADDNIIVGIVGAGSAVANCTGTNNRTGTVVAQNFAAAGSDNYELSATSPACDADDDFSPSEDYEDEARPQDGQNDQGADEAAVCP